MLSNWQIAAFGLFLLLFVVFLGWQLNAWYNYPCEAFKTGLLSGSYAPARCIP